MATGMDGDYTTYTSGLYALNADGITPVFAETLVNQTVTYTITGLANTFNFLSDAGASTILNQAVSSADTYNLVANGGSIVLGSGFSVRDTVNVLLENGGSFSGNGVLGTLLAPSAITFGSNGGSLVIGKVGSFANLDSRNTISGFSAGDVIDNQQLSFLGLTDYTITSTSDLAETLAITDSQGNFLFTLSDSSLTAGTFTSLTDGPLRLTADGNGGTLITVCFLGGTHITVPGGEADVAELRIGDLVETNNGDSLPVRWIGVNKVTTRFADPLRSLPVRIKAGAFDENIPSRDLLLSPDHAMFLDGVLVAAGALVNGTTITRELSMPETFIYYHIELRGHELILAENAPTETFVDNVDRMAFDNWEDYVALFGEAEPVVEMPYPRAKSARQVPGRVRARIAKRVEVLMGDISIAA